MSQEGQITPRLHQDYTKIQSTQAFYNHSHRAPTTYIFFLEDLMKEMINHPSHYNKEGRKECIDEMVEIFGQPLTAIWAIMTAYKYQYRKGLKDEESQELGKIRWYERYAVDHQSGIITPFIIRAYFEAVYGNEYIEEVLKNDKSRD